MSCWYCRCELVHCRKRSAIRKQEAESNRNLWVPLNCKGFIQTNSFPCDHTWAPFNGSVDTHLLIPLRRLACSWCRDTGQRNEKLSQLGNLWAEIPLQLPCPWVMLPRMQCAIQNAPLQSQLGWMVLEQLSCSEWKPCRPANSDLWFIMDSVSLLWNPVASFGQTSEVYREHHQAVPLLNCLHQTAKATHRLNIGLIIQGQPERC